MRLNGITALAGLLLFAGCPTMEEAEQRVMQDERGAAVEQGGVAFEDAGGRMAEAMDSGTQQAQEGMQQTGEAIQEGWGDLRGGVQTQLDAMNEWTEETFAGTFTDDSPDRDTALETYRSDLDRRPTYTVETFDVETATNTEAVAIATIRVDPADHEHGSERRTSRYVLRAVDGEWRVHEVEVLSTERVEPND